MKRHLVSSGVILPIVAKQADKNIIDVDLEISGIIIKEYLSGNYLKEDMSKTVPVSSIEIKKHEYVQILNKKHEEKMSIEPESSVKRIAFLNKSK